MTTSTELARRAEPAGSLALDPGQTQWTDVQRAALAQLKLQDAPEADLAVFLHHCQRTGLDPFARQIYMIARWDSQLKREIYTIQTGIDGFRSIAETHPQYDGQIGPQWCGPDGSWTDVWLKAGPPTAARVGIVRKDRREPIWGVALFQEYAGTVKSGDGYKLNSMWRTKPAHMIAKCAEALGLRKAFPKRLAGLYTPEEVEYEDLQRHTAERTDGAAAGEPTGRPEEIDWESKLAAAVGDVKALQDLYKLAAAMVPNDHALADRIAKAGQEAKAAGDAPVDAEVVDEPDAERMSTDAQLTAIAAALGGHGVTDRDDRLAVVSFLIGTRVETTKALTLSEASSVIDTLNQLDETGQIKDTIRDALAAWKTGEEASRG
jgi:phage recombination protein Bet